MKRTREQNPTLKGLLLGCARIPFTANLKRNRKRPRDNHFQFITLVSFAACHASGYKLKELSGSGDVVVTCGNDGSYNISVAGKLWLKSAPIFFHIRNKTWTTEDGSLTLTNVYKDAGKDAVGKWNSLKFNFTAGTTPVLASFRVYDGVPAVVFGQVSDHIHLLTCQW